MGKESRSETETPKAVYSNLSEQLRLKGQEAEILRRLIAAGSAGCINTDFWTFSRAAHSRVSTLRLRLRPHHFDIESRCQGKGIWRYVLVPIEPLPKPKATNTEPQGALPLFAGVRE